jgi:hypothetical protein
MEQKGARMHVNIVLPNGITGTAWHYPFEFETWEIVGTALVAMELSLSVEDTEIFHGKVAVVAEQFDWQAVRTAVEHVLVQSTKRGIYEYHGE